MTEHCLGRAVTSKAGRDMGRTFLIVGIADDNHVLLADGETRKLANPKKKKLKHVRIEQDVSESICEKLTEGKKVFDAEVRKAILTFGYNSDQNQQEG